MIVLNTRSREMCVLFVRDHVLLETEGRAVLTQGT